MTYCRYRSEGNKRWGIQLDGEVPVYLATTPCTLGALGLIQHLNHPTADHYEYEEYWNREIQLYAVNNGVRTSICRLESEFEADCLLEHLNRGNRTSCPYALSQQTETAPA